MLNASPGVQVAHTAGLRWAVFTRDIAIAGVFDLQEADFIVAQHDFILMQWNAVPSFLRPVSTFNHAVHCLSSKRGCTLKRRICDSTPVCGLKKDLVFAQTNHVTVFEQVAFYLLVVDVSTIRAG